MRDRPLVLTGPPGSGKSAIGPRLAEALGYAHVDIDAVVEAAAGCPVGEIFAREGEAAFRFRELDALRSALAAARVVVSAGGGTLVERAVRHAVLARCTVVSLDAPIEVLSSRVESGAPRPLLKGDSARLLARLVEARATGYAEAHGRYDTSRMSMDEVVARAVALHARVALMVPLGERSYRVEFGELRLAEEAIGAHVAAPRHGLVVTDPHVERLWGRTPGVPALPRVLVPRGERAKTRGQVEKIWDVSLELGADRRWCVVAVGGGTVSDVAGFAAATLLRGVRYVTVPTTLLAMVDASVGGKTAINHARGKNLVGAFHHPSLVWIDPDFARTLSGRDWRAGLAEALKVAVTLDPDLLDLMEEHATALRAPPSRDDDIMVEAVREIMIRHAVQAKIDVVARDEREAGERRVLNFGHTVGHAVESASGYRLRHGECVAVGMAAALELGVRRGVTSPTLRARVLGVMDALGLPTRAQVDARTAAGFLVQDKKREGDAIGFVFCTAAGASTVAEVPLAEVRGALRRVVRG